MAGILATLLAGCAAMETRKPEEVVRERAQARWDLLLKGDVKGAYAYLSPGSRQVITPEGYAGSIRAGFWRGAKVEKAECPTQDRCEVHTLIEYRYSGNDVKSPLKETWVRQDSQWWYLRQ